MEMEYRTEYTDKKIMYQNLPTAGGDFLHKIRIINRMAHSVVNKLSDTMFLIPLQERYW